MPLSMLSGVTGAHAGARDKDTVIRVPEEGPPDCHTHPRGHEGDLRHAERSDETLTLLLKRYIFLLLVLLWSAIEMNDDIFSCISKWFYIQILNISLMFKILSPHDSDLYKVANIKIDDLSHVFNSIKLVSS